MIAARGYAQSWQLKQDLPQDMTLGVSVDNSRLVRESLHEVLITLGIALVLGTHRHLWIPWHVARDVDPGADDSDLAMRERTGCLR